jgi:hypothetical protein
MDVTRPLLRPKDGLYIVEIKIVDDTVNADNIYGIMVRQCSIYLFGNEAK